MDAFNRPIKQRWVKTVTTGGSYVTPVYVDNAIAYSYTSDVTAVLDSAVKDSSGTPKRLFDQLRAFDNLRRLKKQTEGEAASLGGSITTQARIENFARNLAGKTTSDQVSLDSNGTYTDPPLNSLTFGEMNDTRTYNKRNELRTRSVLDNPNPSKPRSVTLTYDSNGNLTGDGEKYTYKYNPWCQLVEVKSIAGGTPVVANFIYNGLGHRIGEQLDTSSGTPGVPDGVVDGSDPMFYMVTDTQGRRVRTFRGTDSKAKEAFVYHLASARGPGFTGGVLLRDREGTLTNPVLWAKDAASGTLDERVYACGDFRGNVSALVSETGTLVEQYRYSATGVPMGIPLGDADGDGKVDGAAGKADYVKTNAAVGGGSGAYKVELDVSLDGLVTAADVTIVTANDGIKTGRGKHSAASVGWRVGWRGMEWVTALNTGTTTRSVYDALTGLLSAASICGSGWPDTIPCGNLSTSEECYACCNVQAEGSPDQNAACRATCAGLPHADPPPRLPISDSILSTAHVSRSC